MLINSPINVGQLEEKDNRRNREKLVKKNYRFKSSKKKIFMIIYRQTKCVC